MNEHVPRCSVCGDDERSDFSPCSCVVVAVRKPWVVLGAGRPGRYVASSGPLRRARVSA